MRIFSYFAHFHDLKIGDLGVLFSRTLIEPWTALELPRKRFIDRFKSLVDRFKMSGARGTIPYPLSEPDS